MKLSTQPYKGARDFYPEDKRLQQWLFTRWSQVIEKYGYEAYDAPILEPTELYLAKGSEEIVQEQTYTFKDRGDRSVTIRTEMTPSVSRMVAGRRQELAYPVRWYSIPNLWRYERMQRGRSREFWQLNVDLFGVSSVEAEIEMLCIIDDLFRVFNASRNDYVIRVNSRKLVNALLADLQLDESQIVGVIRAIDKRDKLDTSVYKALLASIVHDEPLAEDIVELFKQKSLDDLADSVKELESYANLQQIMSVCAQKGLHNIVFDISLMRGFDYYTDIVFEAFDTNPENSRALLGGGRYDGLVGQFGVEPVPTIGFAVGDVGFLNFLQTHKLVPELHSSVQLLLLVRESNTASEVRFAADELREMGLRVAVDYSGRKIDKQFKSALKSGVQYALFIDNEMPNEPRYILKDLRSGREEKHSLQRIVSIVLDSRKA